MGDDAKAFRGQTRLETIGGPCRLYRVTAPDGSGNRGWWFNESQFAGFVDPSTGEFSEERWRAWAAISHDFQPKSETYHIHVLELRQGDSVECTIGKVHHQPMTEGKPFGNVLFMGSGEQLYLHDLPTGQLKEPVVTKTPKERERCGEVADTPEARRLCGEVAERHPERLGRRDAPGPPRTASQNRNAAPRSRSENGRGAPTLDPVRETMKGPPGQRPTPSGKPPKPSRRK